MYNHSTSSLQKIYETIAQKISFYFVLRLFGKGRENENILQLNSSYHFSTFLFKKKKA